MKRVISFSLWGDHPRYNIGAIKNAELAKIKYPDFECWFYVHKDSTSSDIIEKLEAMSNTKIIFKVGPLDRPMTWRFESIDDPAVEINMSRDTDTRILEREKVAVYEWIDSGKSFHIMRDHPHHMNPNMPIMGGMFGTRKLRNIPSWTNILNTKIPNLDHAYDQNMLASYIYPVICNNCIIHSTFGGLLEEKEVLKFRIPYCNNFYFVGGYVYEDGTTSKIHTDILKEHLG